jgi:hypothetical protein
VYTYAYTGKKLTVGNYKLGKVHMFKYPGSLVTDKNDVSVEIKNRIERGNKRYCGLRQRFPNFYSLFPPYNVSLTSLPLHLNKFK